MKSPGRLVFYTDKTGNIQYGRTYNNENLVNGKVVVHLLTDDLEHIQDEKGQNKKVLVEAEKLSIKGYVD